MYTSYTINTALSKDVESFTRHHSPLTTEYISFQHIYKSYDERSERPGRKRGDGGGGVRGGGGEARCMCAVATADPLLRNGGVNQACAMIHYTESGGQFVETRTGGCNTSASENISAQLAAARSIRQTGSETGGSMCGNKSLLQH